MRRKKAQSEPTPAPRKIALRVIYLRETDYWVAQCLEHDIAAQGKTLSEVEDAFRKTLVGQIVLDLRKGREPLEDIKPAPSIYWRKFREGLRLGVEPNIELPSEIPPAFMIEGITSETRILG